jgi:hypothetical protein
VSLVKPTVQSGSIVFIQNLFYNFWTLLQVSTNFGSLKQFLEFKTIENDLKSAAHCWAETGPRLQCAPGGLSHTSGRKGLLGHGLVAQSSRGGGPHAACALGALRRGHRAQPTHRTARWRARRWPGDG